MANSFTLYPSEIDLAWLAGLMEGEGSFFQLKTSPGVPVLSIGMNDEDVIAKASKMLGVSYQTILPRGKNKNKRYKFMVVGRSRAGRIMGSLYSYMGERRRKQIEKALEFAPGTDTNLTIIKEGAQ